jgi:hypothetical protein
VTVLWLAGFEHGSAAWIANGNTDARYISTNSGGVVTSGDSHTGTYCWEGDAVAGVSFDQFSVSTAILGTQADLAGTFYVKFFTSLPTADCDVLLMGNSVSSDDQRLRFRASDSKLILDPGNSGTIRVGPVVTTNTWYRIDWSWNGTTSTCTVKWSVDGTAQTDATCSVGSASNSAGIFYGFDSSAATGHMRFDDLIITDNAADHPLGAHRIAIVKADTGGSTTQVGTANATVRFTTNGGGLDATHNSANILAALSELPPTFGGTATGLYQRTSGAGNACTVPMTSNTLSAGETITGVRALFPGWAATTTASNWSIDGSDGVTPVVLFALADPNFDNTSTPSGISRMFTSASGGWNQTKLDALTFDLGFATDISPLTGVHACYAEVAIKLAASPNAGSTAVTLALAVAAAGARPSRGSVAVTLGLGVAAAGARPSRGATAPTLGLGVSASGARPSRGSTALGLGLGVAAAGARPSRGGAALGLGLGVAAAGARLSRGSTALGLGLGVDAAGERDSVGSTDVGLHLTVTAQSGGALAGQVFMGLHFAVAAHGQRPSLGSAHAGLGLAVASIGGRAARGSTALGLGLAVAATGRRQAAGHVSVGFGLGLAARGARASLGAASIGLALRLAAFGPPSSGHPAKISAGTRRAATVARGATPGARARGTGSITARGGYADA